MKRLQDLFKFSPELSEQLRREIPEPPHQFQMALPPSRPEDRLTEQLAETVSDFNASTDPDERTRLYSEICDLRQKIQIARGDG